MENIVKVGMADLQAVNHPSILTTLGLGSCVGISLYDKSTKIIGMAHCMLPYNNEMKNNQNLAKFVDSAIYLLIDNMVKLGTKKNNITAKLAGGAQMFSHNNISDIMRIGARNVVASKETLQKFNIPIIAEDTGGNYGRTIELFSDNGKLLIKTIGYGVKEL